MICHNPHESEHNNLLIRPINSLCSDCHENASSGKHVIKNFGYDHPIQNLPDPLRSGEMLSCISCHSPHGSETELFFLNNTGPEHVCLMCHTR